MNAITVFVSTALGFVGIYFISFIGILLTLFGGTTIQRISDRFATFSSGILLGTAFLFLLPQNLKYHSKNGELFILMLAGTVLYFIIDSILTNYLAHRPTKPAYANYVVWPVLNGLILGLSFAVSTCLGIVISAAMAFFVLSQTIIECITLRDCNLQKYYFYIPGYYAVLMINTLPFMLMSKSILAHFATLTALATGGLIYLALRTLTKHLAQITSGRENVIHILIALVGIGCMVGIRILTR